MNEKTEDKSVQLVKTVARSNIDRNKRRFLTKQSVPDNGSF